MKRTSRLAALAFSATLLAGGLAWPASALGSSTCGGTGSVTTVNGTLADGATYLIQCPAGTWNGTLFLYSHGYVVPVAVEEQCAVPRAGRALDLVGRPVRKCSVDRGHRPGAAAGCGRANPGRRPGQSAGQQCHRKCEGCEFARSLHDHAPVRYHRDESGLSRTVAWSGFAGKGLLPGFWGIMYRMNHGSPQPAVRQSG